MAECILRFCRPTPSTFNPAHKCAFFADQLNLISPQPKNDDTMWLKLRHEAESDVAREPVLSEFYTSAILSHASLEGALADRLSAKLSDANLSREVLCSVFLRALLEDGEIRAAVRADLRAFLDRDPACSSYVHCFLNFKGFLACQAHRVAHKFWGEGRAGLARILQGRVSEAFAVDIHPGAKIGKGVVFDHATGVVIGETAVVGDDVTILHQVTLGGTGKEAGDRHPKIGDGVVIGAGAKVLGSVRVGEGAKIGAGAVVLKEVPPRATAVGNPARLVGLR